MVGKRLLVILTAILSILIVSGCQSKSSQEENSNESESQRFEKFVDETILCVKDQSNNNVSQNEIDNKKVIVCLKDKRIASAPDFNPTFMQIEQRKKSEYTLWVLEYQQKIYSQQLVTGIILFFVSIIVLVVGLLFSYFQFAQSLKSASSYNPVKSPDDNNEETKENNASHHLTIGVAGVEISTSVMGLIILIISLAFFYLYIEKIYPITYPDGSIQKIPKNLLEQKWTINKLNLMGKVDPWLPDTFIQCQFHFAQNAEHYASKKSLKPKIAEAIAEVFSAKNKSQALDIVKQINSNDSSALFFAKLVFVT